MTNHEGFELEFGFKMPQRQSDSLLFYCKLGGRAQKACSIAKSLGYQTICYPGSWIEWKEKSEQQVKS